MNGDGSPKVLCAVDLGHEAQERGVLRRAAALAGLDGAELNVLTVVPTPSGGYLSYFFPEGAREKLVAHARAALHTFVTDTLGSDAGVRHIVGSGSVYEAILETAETIGASLIVLGAHRPDLKDYLLGPNASRVARHAAISVHIVRDAADRGTV